MRTLSKILKLSFMITGVISFICVTSIDDKNDDWLAVSIVASIIFASSIVGAMVSDKLSHVILILPDSLLAFVFGVINLVKILSNPYPNERGSRRYIKYCKSHNKRIRNRYSVKQRMEE